MSNISLPLQIQSLLLENKSVKIYYPQVIRHRDMYVQNKINEAIKHKIETLVENQFVEQDVNTFDEMIGTFEIKTNERNIFSLSLSNYAYPAFAAHGLSLMESLTFSVESGEVYKLGDLFKSNQSYIKRISQKIKRQIERRNIPLLEPFKQIKKEQNFYIADKALVIYFPMYELTPGSYGFPMFPISVYELEDIVRKEGPLGRMIAD